jgi:hypothetical protein
MVQDTMKRVCWGETDFTGVVDGDNNPVNHFNRTTHLLCDTFDKLKDVCISKAVNSIVFPDEFAMLSFEGVESHDYERDFFAFKLGVGNGDCETIVQDVRAFERCLRGVTIGRQWSTAGFEVDIISGGWGCGGNTTIANDPVGNDLRGFDGEYIVSEHKDEG